ncbi:MAG: hypothetical protein N3A01_04750 [Bacteroidales bacterium]|nr:hypothetical protein [Bacteroidales bacterium]
MKKLLLAMFMVICFNNFFSQNDSSYKHLHYSIRIDPFRLFNVTLFIIGEKQISNNSSIEFSPIIIYGSKEDNFIKELAIARPEYENNIYTKYSNNFLIGGGLYISYKHYLDNKKHKISGTYINNKIIMQRTSISTLETIWTYVNSDKLIISEEEKTYNLNSLFLAIDFGYKLLLRSKFCIDVYIGGGLKLSKYDHQSLTKYRDIGNYDYSGVTISIGGSIGFIK